MTVIVVKDSRETVTVNYGCQYVCNSVTADGLTFEVWTTLQLLN